MKAATKISFALTRLFMLLFVYSATAKFLDFAEFRSELAKSPFLHPIAGFMAWLVPVAEIIVGVMLLIRRTRSFALYTYFYMMAAFTAYVYLMMKKAYYLPCACMGIIDDLGWEAHLWFNGAITVLVLAALLLETKNTPRLAKAVLPAWGNSKGRLDFT